MRKTALRLKPKENGLKLCSLVLLCVCILFFNLKICFTDSNLTAVQLVKYLNSLDWYLLFIDTSFVSNLLQKLSYRELVYFYYIILDLGYNVGFLDITKLLSYDLAVEFGDRNYLEMVTYNYFRDLLDYLSFFTYIFLLVGSISIGFLLKWLNIDL